jgi:carnitine O-acetyltransferase
MEVYPDSKHITVLRRGQFCKSPIAYRGDLGGLIYAIDWFDVLDEDNLPLLTEREVLRHLQAIVSDADTLDRSEVARKAIGVLSTENRKIWSGLRKMLQQDRNNAGCLQIIDRALFVVCLDDATPENLADLCSNFLCGTYSLQGGEQVGTCTNRWYDKVIVLF